MIKLIIILSCNSFSWPVVCFGPSYDHPYPVIRLRLLGNKVCTALHTGSTLHTRTEYHQLTYNGIQTVVAAFLLQQGILQFLVLMQIAYQE